MGSKRIVVISAKFYPNNSPRSFRTTELAKEFSKQGHDVTVYTILGKYDYTEFENTHKLKVRNLGEMKFVPYTSDGDSKQSLLRSIVTKLLRKIIEYPSIELFFKASQVLKREKNVDLLLTIAYPYPIHWGAAYAERYFEKNIINTWVADCGDPYMGNRFFKHPFYFKYVEKWFCEKVDYLTIPIKEAKEGYYKEFHHKIRIIPQGLNFEELKVSEKLSNNSVITFVYAGTLYKGIRDPRPFLDYLCELDIDFKFIVFTKSVLLLEDYKSILRDKLEIHDYIPRLDLFELMSQADFLVNFENNTVVQSPSKLIDYALSKRPILSVNSLQINKKDINEFLNRNYVNQLIIKDIEQYNIKNVVNSFISLIR